MNKAREIRLDVIDYLVDRKFKSAGDVPFPSLEQWLEWREPRGATLEPFFEDQATYRAELEEMALPALNKLLAQAMNKEAIHQRRRAELEDQARFFNEESAQADFGYWGKMPHWTLDEATALSFGKSPVVVDWEKVKACLGQSSFAEAYSKHRMLLLRAWAAGDLQDPGLPADFIEWAERTGIALPPGLVDATRAAVGRIEDWRSLAAERDELEKRVKSLELEAAKERPLSTRERGSLLKMVLGMAMEQYGYEPTATKNKAPGEIVDDLVAAGITIDEATVLKWLRTASDEVERA